MTPEMAEIRSLHVLGWLVGSEELLPVFLGATGAGLEDLKTRAAEPEFLASVLDFVMMDDEWVRACAEALGIPPQDLAQIRAGLPGGQLPNWT